MYVLDEPAAIEKKFKRAVTDSGSEVRRARRQAGRHQPDRNPRGRRAASTPEAVEARDGRRAGYGELKAAVAAAVVDYLAPVRERYAELRADEAALEAILADGAERARGRSPRRRSRTCASGWAWAPPARARGVGHRRPVR